MAAENAFVFKVVLVGDGGDVVGGNGANGGVGKTIFLKRLRGLDFDSRYRATLGVDVYPIRFMTNFGEVCFNIWDVAGQERFGGLRDGYYVGAHGCIAMFDATKEATLHHVESWLDSVRGVVPEINYVVACNKCDEPSAQYFHPGAFPISSKSGNGIWQPIEELARFLTNRPTLRILGGDDDASVEEEVYSDEEKFFESW